MAATAAKTIVRLRAGTAGAKAKRPRTQPTARDLEAVASRNDILRVAIDEFAEFGLNGARVDLIAEKTKTSKRMIYYYFGSKEGLYIHVLEAVYAGIREAEAHLDIEHLPVEEALRTYVENTFDYQTTHPHVGRLISIENIQHGRFIKRSRTIRAANAVAISRLSNLVRRGQTTHRFKPNVAAEDLFYLVNALCVYRVSNRSTFDAIFGIDFASPQILKKHRKLVVETIMSLVLEDPERATG